LAYTTLKLVHPFVHAPLDWIWLNSFQFRSKWDTKNQHEYFIKWLYVFFFKFVFSYEWILEQLFLQLVIINVYNCPSTCQFFFFIIFNKYDFFMKVSWFLANSMFCLLKITIISNHNIYLFLHFYVSLYNKLQLFKEIMYILPYLCVAQDFWKSKILDQFWKVIWNF
jgi:hypothetical protein